MLVQQQMMVALVDLLRDAGTDAADVI